MLESLPGVGKVKARRTMEEIGIAETRRLRGLGKEQRAKLLDAFAVVAVVARHDLGPAGLGHVDGRARRRGRARHPAPRRRHGLPVPRRRAGPDARRVRRPGRGRPGDRPRARHPPGRRGPGRRRRARVPPGRLDRHQRGPRRPPRCGSPATRSSGPRRVAGREGVDVDAALAANRAREASEAARYRAYYGIDIADLRAYDLVLDTTVEPPPDRARLGDPGGRCGSLRGPPDGGIDRSLSEVARPWQPPPATTRW